MPHEPGRLILSHSVTARHLVRLARRLSPDATIADFISNEILRICMPARFGGFELGYDDEVVLLGEQDRIVTHAYRESWRRALPHAAVATIPDAGHYPHWEQPDDFTTRVLAFAEQH